jgi:hypothetical protein
MIEIQERCVRFTPPEGAASLIGDFTDWDERPFPIPEPVTIEFPEGPLSNRRFSTRTNSP